MFPFLHYTDTVNGIVYDMWELEDGSRQATVCAVDETWLNKGVAPYSGDIMLPDSVTYKMETFPVSAIGYKAFSECDGLKTISIPPTIKEVSTQAFWRSTNMEGVYISDLKAWCEILFYGSNPLEYAHNLYLNGKLLTEIIVPDGITAIRNYAFHSGNFSRIELPESVTEIGNSAFTKCLEMTEIVMSPNIINIGRFAFDSCKSLKTITIPDQVELLERMTFYHCENLTDVTLPKGLRTIEAQTFSDCYSLENINYPDSLETIGTSAFYACSSLRDPEFSAGLKTIGNTAFYGNRRWHTLNLPVSLSALGAAAFFCDNLEIFTIAAKEMPERLDENTPFPFTDDGVIVAGFPTESLADYRNNSRFKYFMQDNSGSEKPRLDVSLPSGVTMEFTKTENSGDDYPWGVTQDKTTLFIPRYTTLTCRLSSDDKDYSIVLDGKDITDTLSGSTFEIKAPSSRSTLVISEISGVTPISDVDGNMITDIYTTGGLRVSVSSPEQLRPGLYIVRDSKGNSKKITIRQ